MVVYDMSFGINLIKFDFDLINKIEIVCACCLLLLENGYIDLRQTWHAYSLKPRRDFRKVKTPKKCNRFESRRR
jgi:transcription initiation factor TFIIIB Brf1 subunit/transcription initiation factor TFIIB